MSQLPGRGVIGRALLGTAIGAILVARLPAQSPPDRQSLQWLSDSLSFVLDTTALLEHERALIDRARGDRDNPMVHLRLGILALRLSVLRPEARHREDALSEFTWASELRPDWPWPWYGIGLAEAHGPDRAAGFAGGLFAWFGLDRDRLAGEAFAHALRVDPTFVSGLREFARVALTERIGAPVGTALTALRVALAAPNAWDPELLIYLGRLERRAGFADSALVAFRRAERLGRHDGLAWFEIARTLPLVDSTDIIAIATTTRAYLLGAKSERPSLVAMYRRDIEPIAGPDELAAFDALIGPARAAWLARFWRRRDAIDLRPPGARLAEHYRRRHVAMQNFRLPPFRRLYQFGVERYRSGDAEFDDRGIVYLRQGEPTLRVIWPVGRPAFHASSLDRTYGSESWRYDRSDGQLILHFVAREDPQDFRLVDGPAQLDVSYDALAEQSHTLPDVARLLRTAEASSVWVGEALRRQSLGAMAIATQTDSWQRHYDHPMTARVAWLAAGVRGGRPLLHIIYSVSADAVRERSRLTGGSKVAARVRAVVIGPDDELITTLDTVQLLGIPSEGARLVAARAELPVVSGQLLVRVGIELSAEVGQVFPFDSVVAPAVDGSSLDASALLIGRRNRSLPWRKGSDETVWLDAAGVYGGHDTLSVYAESYGTKSGDTVSFTIELSQHRGFWSRLFGGGSGTIALSETVAAQGKMTPFRREISLDGIEPGDYTVTLTIESSGRSIERHRGITIGREH